MVAASGPKAAQTDVGFDHLYWHQIGRDQEGFIAFAERELLPRLRS